MDDSDSNFARRLMDGSVALESFIEQHSELARAAMRKTFGRKLSALDLESCLAWAAYLITTGISEYKPDHGPLNAYFLVAAKKRAHQLIREQRGKHVLISDEQLAATNAAKRLELESLSERIDVLYRLVCSLVSILTPREQIVFEAIIKCGGTDDNAVIAAETGLSPECVATHKCNAFRKIRNEIEQRRTGESEQ